MIAMGMDFYFDTETQDIIKDKTVVLNIKGLKGSILEVLLTANKEIYLSKDELIESVWGKSSLVVGVNSLTQQIYLLRKSLRKIGLHNYILSRAKVGYKVSKKFTIYGEDYSIIHASNLPSF